MSNLIPRCQPFQLAFAFILLLMVVVWGEDAVSGVDTAPMQVGVAAMAEATGGIRPRLFPPIQQVHPMR